METIYVGKIRDVLKHKDELEKKLDINLKIVDNSVNLDGTPLNEYEAKRVFDAISFGFSVKKSLVLKDEEMDFKIIHIKDHTKRALKDIKSRLIGKRGKTRRTFSEISGCEILIKESEVGIIGNVGSVEDAEVAIVNLIKGSKQSNMYRFLEKQNSLKKKFSDEGFF